MIQYDVFQDFIEEVATNISTSGLFIQTAQPREAGTRFDFEIRLGDGFPLLRGRGEVMWVREPSEEATLQSGMGVRFLEVDEPSRTLIDKIVQKNLEKGGEPFDLAKGLPEGEIDPEVKVEPEVEVEVEEEAEVAGEVEPEVEAEPAAAAEPEPLPPVEQPAETEPPEDEPALSPAPAGPSLLRLGLLLVLSSILGGLLVIAFQQMYILPSIDSLEVRVEELSASPGALPLPMPPADSPPVAPLPEPAAEGGPSVGDEESSASSPDAREMVRDWARAWSEQRSDDYLAFYSVEFVPPDGLPRDEWEAMRRVRLERPRAIQVSATLMTERELEDGSTEVSFTQSYRSERFADLVRKTLRLIKEEGRWRIAEERIER